MEEADDETAQEPENDFRVRVLPEAKTLAVPEAGKTYFKLGRNASYEAAKRGDLPVIRIGARLRVPIVALERMLLDAGRKSDDHPRIVDHGKPTAATPPARRRLAPRARRSAR